jgi:hypothetical protein
LLICASGINQRICGYPVYEPKNIACPPLVITTATLSEPWVSPGALRAT